jgi:hypothetical protein
MHCHVCEKGSIGMCRQCYKFYCATHGDGFCEVCKNKGWTSTPAATPKLAATAIANLEDLPKELQEKLKSGAVSLTTSTKIESKEAVSITTSTKTAGKEPEKASTPAPAPASGST